MFLLAQGIQPAFYESGYNRYFEDVLFENPDLWNFKPDIVFIHTTWHNVSEFPDLLETEVEVEERVRREMARFESLWEKIHTELGRSSSRTTLIFRASDPGESGGFRIVRQSEFFVEAECRIREVCPQPLAFPDQ